MTEQTVKLALLEQNVAQHQRVLERFDEALFGINKLCNTIEKLLSTHEIKIDKQNQEQDKIFQMLEDNTKKQEELTDKINQISLSQIKISDKMDDMKDVIDRDRQAHEQKIDDLSNRVSSAEVNIKSNERWRYTLYGIGTAIMALLGILKFVVPHFTS